jgi:uncharacterized protein
MIPDSAVPLFPLPNILLYPGAMLPLHVFEPRYVQLVEELLHRDDPTLTMALLQPDWERDYFGEPPIFPVSGLGRMLNCQPVRDGRFNILVEGLARVSFSEIESDKMYRQGEIQTLTEIPPHDSKLEHDLRQQIHTAFALQSDDNVMPDPARDLGYLADVLLITLGADMEEKQRIFSILDVAERAQAVLKLVADAQALNRSYTEARHHSGHDPRLN